jgi:hypothetical protein
MRISYLRNHLLPPPLLSEVTALFITFDTSYTHSQLIVSVLVFFNSVTFLFCGLFLSFPSYENDQFSTFSNILSIRCCWYQYVRVGYALRLSTHVLSLVCSFTTLT